MDKATVNSLIQYLKESFINIGVKVDNIALFGSAMTDTMRADSDVDLIIISQDYCDKDIFERVRMSMHPEIDTQRKFNIPLDVLHFTPEEYERHQQRRFYPSKIIA